MTHTAPHILVIEDDADVAELVQSALEEDGFVVSCEYDGAKGLAKAQSALPDLILLDMSLPSLKGTDICRELKQDPATSHLPVVFLTGHVDDSDVVLGLELGGEDYVKKPFSAKELVARVRAILRRTKKPAVATSKTHHLRHGHLVLDRAGFDATWEGNPIHLTQAEFHLLWLLAEQPGVVSSRERLLNAINQDTKVADRTIDVHVASIRKKLGTDGRHIVTVRGVGYKWND